MRTKGALGQHTWDKCLRRLNTYQTLHKDYWDEYQLLGYWCQLTKMPFDDEGVYPSRHPQIKKMRLIVWATNHPDSRPSTSDMPTNYSSENVKQYLDWCWEEMMKQDLPCHSLSFIIGDKTKWLSQFKRLRGCIEKDIDYIVANLDLGD